MLQQDWPVFWKFNPCAVVYSCGAGVSSQNSIRVFKHAKALAVAFAGALSQTWGVLCSSKTRFHRGRTRGSPCLPMHGRGCSSAAADHGRPCQRCSPVAHPVHPSMSPSRPSSCVPAHIENKIPIKKAVSCDPHTCHSPTSMNT